MRRLSEGDVVGNFTLLRQTRAGGYNKHRRFLVRCDPCGKELEKNTNDVYKQTSCGCLHFHSTREDALSAIMYSHLGKRHREYDGHLISLETFRLFSEQDCHYCGTPPSNIAREAKYPGEWKYSGLDRIDSSFGYVDGNVRPCCKRCNVAKSDMTEGEFLSHVLRIVQHQRRYRT